MKEYKIIGMAHRWCIDNPIIVTLFLIGWAIVAIYYIKFVKINDDIRKIKTSQGQSEADETFKWFSWVFWTCALTRLLSSITMFWGFYLLELIFIIINAYVIVKCYYVYKRQKILFITKTYSEEDVMKSGVDAKSSLLDDILKLNLSDEAKEAIESIKE